LPWQSCIAALDVALLAASAEPTGASATATTMSPARTSRYMFLVLQLPSRSSTLVIATDKWPDLPELCGRALPQPNRLASGRQRRQTPEIRRPPAARWWCLAAPGDGGLRRTRRSERVPQRPTLAKSPWLWGARALRASGTTALAQNGCSKTFSSHSSSTMIKPRPARMPFNASLSAICRPRRAASFAASSTSLSSIPSLSMTVS
jgi:hypothetical protein